MENCGNCVDDSFYSVTNFASEFGWIGMPSLEALSPVLGRPEDDYTFLSPAMLDRQNRITPAATSQNMLLWNFDQYATPYITKPDASSFRRVIHMSQVAQTDCLRAEAEHYRRGRDTLHATAGSTYWMLNDNWPTASWASLEYGGRPKLLHYAAAQFYSAVAVSSFCTPSITACTGVVVHIGSEKLEPLKNAVLQVDVIRWTDGVASTVAEQSVSLGAQGGATFAYNGTRFTSMLKTAGCASVSDCFVSTKLVLRSDPHGSGGNDGSATAAGEIAIAPPSYQWLTLWKHAVLKPATFTLTTATLRANEGAGDDTQSAVEVTVTSNVVAPQAMVHCGEASDFGSFDTNALLLLPNVPTKFIYTPRAFEPAGKHTPCAKGKDFYVVAVNGITQ